MTQSTPGEYLPTGRTDRDTQGDHWVTIDGNHVLIHEPQGAQNPINMSVRVAKEPGVILNERIGGQYGTGVAAELRLTFTDSNGRPLQGNVTENNVEQGEQNRGSVALSPRGTMVDWVGYVDYEKSPGNYTPEQVANFTSSVTSKPHTLTSTQTLTVVTAKGTYQVDWKRTFSNVAANGKLTKNFTITWSTPVIKQIAP
jgi:hypothetical protein